MLDSTNANNSTEYHPPSEPTETHESPVQHTLLAAKNTTINTANKISLPSKNDGEPIAANPTTSTLESSTIKEISTNDLPILYTTPMWSSSLSNKISMDVYTYFDGPLFQWESLPKEQPIAAKPPPPKPKPKPAPRPKLLTKPAKPLPSPKKKTSRRKLSPVKKENMTIPKGVTVRPSGKWQAQIYFAGASRYIGVYRDSAMAAVAYNSFRSFLLQYRGKTAGKSRESLNEIVEKARKHTADCVKRILGTESAARSAAEAFPVPKVSREVAIPSEEYVAHQDSEPEEEEQEDDATKDVEMKSEASSSPTKASPSKTDDASAAPSTPHLLLAHDLPPTPSSGEKSVKSSEMWRPLRKIPTKVDVDGVTKFEDFRGITRRPSGKWQGQAFYQGASRYVGVYQTQEEAASACRIFKEHLRSHGDNSSDPATVKRLVVEARKAAAKLVPPS